MICASYFDAPFGECVYDAAVSVESLHHFTKKEKIPLYKKLCASLVADGYFILTDYFAKNEKEEEAHRQSLIAIKEKEGITDRELYHYDTPLFLTHHPSIPGTLLSSFLNALLAFFAKSIDKGCVCSYNFLVGTYYTAFPNYCQPLSYDFINIVSFNKRSPLWTILRLNICSK